MAYKTIEIDRSDTGRVLQAKADDMLKAAMAELLRIPSVEEEKLYNKEKDISLRFTDPTPKALPHIEIIVETEGAINTALKLKKDIKEAYQKKKSEYLAEHP